MDEELLLWSAGRDFANLRRSANPEVPQTETFNNIALFRKLFLEGGIYHYWNYFRPHEKAKLQIEYSSVRTKHIQVGQTYLLVLTGDQWSDLLLGGIAAPDQPLREVHSGMTLGPLANHIKSSVILAHDKYAFTPEDLIKYHAYALGEVHLNAKEKRRVDAYDKMILDGAKNYPVQFGNNGPSSLALKGFLNRVIRSQAFRHMLEALQQRGCIPDDVEYPTIRADGLQEAIEKHGYDASVASLRWTERAMQENGPARHFRFITR